eukprot:CAMPEP_0113703574 /NCGR_PEP_ID=MMETSP0038_2-20120614/25951_1 /TAXON_ID=2898 /ORGANISM="Cryptomonas paramecium" /LENGTH=456 /DNA_ID=CAMNT_0000628083 /DNA_START=85 /DNA_END=1451 /DNA_ORIENTATION=- /assembly_acc=CAM_ASM_000170
MYVLKVQYGEVTRRITIQEPFDFKSVLVTVVGRFELGESEAPRAQLRYVDPDGDVISMNSDAELAEALSLASSDAQAVLKMKLVVTGECVNSPKSSGSVVVVEASDDLDVGSAKADEEEKMRSQRAALLEAEQMEAERREAERIEAERIEAERIEAERIEAERIEAERIEAERIEAERIEAERIQAERLEAERIEAEHLEAEQEALRKQREDEARVARIAAEAAERALLEEQMEILQRCEIAICAEREDAVKRVSSLRKMGCSVESLRTIFAQELLDLTAVAEAEVAVAPAQSSPVEFVDCAETGAAADKAAAAEEEAEVEVVPEPVVDWDLQKYLTDSARNGLSFPSAEQTLAVVEAGNRAKDLATLLTEFYMVHNPDNVHRVPDLVKQFKGREPELNSALVKRYRCDLTTFRECAPTAVDAMDAPEEAPRVPDTMPAAAAASMVAAAASMVAAG